MKIVSQCYYSLLLNGNSVGFIKANKGLRQGDPLFPALFILMSEYLSKSLNVLFENNPQMYYCVPRGIAISHLSYAHDCIVFCNGSILNVLKLQIFLMTYERETGQRINLSKSGVLAGKRANFALIIETLNMSSMTFPFSYLGAPIFKGRNKKVLFVPLVDKIRARFTGWNLDLMSQGSRLTLIKSVLNALPVYILQALHPPKSIMADIGSILAKFF